jgi:hypothetical protein
MIAKMRKEFIRQAIEVEDREATGGKSSNAYERGEISWI